MRSPIITIDLEDWFHLLECDAIPGPEAWGTLESRIERNTNRVLALLANHGIRATFFTLGWVAETYPSLLKTVASQGHEIGCHSGLHTLIHQQTPEAFRMETRRAVDAISGCIGLPVTAYRAPGFSLTSQSLWAFELLGELGITTDCSVFPGRHAHGGTGGLFPPGPFKLECRNGMQLREFPMTLAQVGPLDIAFAGGGYFRFFPYAMIARWIRANPDAMTYFHPRDFDEGQPRIQGLSALRKFKAYAGLKGAHQKLDRFLHEFGGQSLGEASARIDWDQSPLVRL
ncbi:polysaccharide deacetylase family protein [Geothrix fuzhouensis]|uniref:polysaccharide deacetylase family protein n=1 Tax=Geothrix fuzhouensis TaxID=2966451 RepID=UPI0021499086